MDETIDTTEMMTPFAALQLEKEQEKGQLPAGLAERVRALLKAGFEVYNRILTQLGGENAPGAKEAATKQLVGAIMRPTVVTDDEMGHWIQKLDGRRIVVIMDSCHSGGMNRTEGAPTKDLEVRRGRFDFLSGEFARLKDLDQPSLTVLGAASEDESSTEVGLDRNGAFTGAILKLMSSSAGPVDARQALDHSKTAIIERYRVLNEARARHNREHPQDKPMEPGKPFTPSFFTTDAKPIYLKPPAADSNADPAQKKD
jgi:Caspase domain